MHILTFLIPFTILIYIYLYTPHPIHPTLLLHTRLHCLEGSPDAVQHGLDKALSGEGTAATGAGRFQIQRQK